MIVAEACGGHLYLSASLVASAVSSWPVVTGIEATVVGGPIDPNPVGPIDAASIVIGRADGKSTGDLDPAVLLHGDGADLVGNFGEVLILAEDQGDIVRVISSGGDDIKGEANVDAFLVADENRGNSTAGESDGLIAILERAGEGPDADAAHLGELGCPEVIPE